MIHPPAAPLPGEKTVLGLVAQLGAGRVAALWALLLLCAAIFPFKPGYGGPARLGNGARLVDDGTLFMAGPSFVRGVEPPAWLARALAEEQLTLRFEARTARPGQQGPARLLTLSESAYRRNLTVAQKGVDLVVRVRRGASDENGAPPLKVDGIFAASEWRTFEIRVTPATIEIFIDGDARYRDVQESSPFALWDPSFRFAVGDEVDGARGWDGALRGLEVDVAGETFAPLRDGSLELPDTLWHVPEKSRRLLRMEDSHALLVGLLHFMAFVPFGVLLFMVGRPRRLGLAAIGAGVGLLIQLVKLFFESRHPSLYHVLPNALGSVAGAWFASIRYRLPQ